MEQLFEEVGPGRVALVATCAVLLGFFAATIVAVARGRGAAVPTFLLNLFGWTIIGWLVAWLVAFRDYRRVVYVAIGDPGGWLGDQVFSPAATTADGRYGWDGYAWRDRQVLH
jgi:hypothetical protein